MPENALSYIVERSSRRTVGLYVERDGKLLVRAPLTLSDDRIASIVETKRKWVIKAQARWAALNPQRQQREFVSGETIYFLGQPHRLDFVARAPDGVSREGDFFILPSDRREDAERLLKEYYRAEGQARLPPIVTSHSSSMGLTPSRVRVQELGMRWGSCSSRGILNFHWRCLALPLDVLHYLVTHELAHLAERNHSPAFWALVERELPRWRTQARWLDIHGAQMTL